MSFRIDELFADPTPNGIVNQRLVMTMLNVAERTEMNSKEKQDFMNLILLVGKKLIGVWRHLQNYIAVEEGLCEEAKKMEAMEKQKVQRVAYSLDLFLEFDGFYVQTKSTLDYLIKIPLPILGNKTWPLRTFSDKGEAVINALNRNVPKRFANKARLIETMLTDKHMGWLATAIEVRNRINHCLDGGIDFRIFIVIKKLKEGVEFIHVPTWEEGVPIRTVLEATWQNLFMLCEDFIGGFLFMRLPENYAIVHKPTPLDTPRSPWLFFNSQEAADAYINLLGGDWSSI
jgi:hypothetical protein